MTDWAVVDVESTGLYWKHVERVVEIAAVRLDENGHQVDSWSTLLNPDRDLGPAHFHGITARDARGSPTFDQVADELMWFLGGHVPVGHNIRFDLGLPDQRVGSPRPRLQLRRERTHDGACRSDGGRPELDG
jgi:DNA polymerase-3 subunit epsilon